MEARYRQDYPGEFVITHSKWAGGKKQETREWIENPIDNQHLSGRAAVIGSSDDRDSFDYQRLEKHRGGLLSSLKLQTYGTAKIALEMRLDFAVDIDFGNLQPLIDNKYVESNIVYTSAKNCLRQPGEFYLIPLNPHLCAEILPIYLAAFDGHNEIFLHGYSRETNIRHQGWIDQVTSVINAYSGITFFIVGNELNMPDAWLECSNTKSMNFRNFITYCDV